MNGASDEKYLSPWISVSDFIKQRKEYKFCFKLPLFTIHSSFNWQGFYPQGNLVMSGKIFGSHNLEVMLLVGRSYGECSTAHSTLDSYPY